MATTLSQRAQEWHLMSSDMLIWTVLNDLYHPEQNPSGYVSLGVAENTLMHDEMRSYISRLLSNPSNIPSTALTYGDGGAGTKRLKLAIANFLTYHLKPTTQINAASVLVMNGVSSAIEHISSLLADPGDAILLGQPHYGAFVPDIEIRTGVSCVPVSFGDLDPLGSGCVEAYAAKVQKCQESGQRVAALMLCNPHNPLGRCYPRPVIEGLMRLCAQHDIHFISDEIYALSVWDESSPESVPFTSALSIAPASVGIKSEYVHVLWGMSKDFGANGLRIGSIVSPGNPALIQAFTPVSIYSYASSLSEIVASSVLEDMEWSGPYIKENHRRLKRNYEICRKWAQGHGIQVAGGVNAAFFLWVDFGEVWNRDECVQKRLLGARNVNGDAEGHGNEKVREEADKAEMVGGDAPTASVPDREEGGRTELNKQITESLIAQRIFLASGTEFGAEKSGWFRIVFSQEEEYLRLGLGRIEKALGLGEFVVRDVGKKL